MSAPTSVPRDPQHGMTLIELMLAMSLSLGVALSAMALLNTVRSSYLAIHDQALVQDTGRYALDVIAQALRQANFVPYDDPALSGLEPARLSPGVIGLDNARLLNNTAGISAPQSNAAHHRSDVLAIRFFGTADQGQVNCAGFAVKAASSGHSASDYSEQRGWSIFYVAADSTGTPELRCKYSTRDGSWNTAAVARGVEALQVLYGVSDRRSNGISNSDDDGVGSMIQYLPATHMTAARWRQVVAVRYALLVRGEYASRIDSNGSDGNLHALFGSAYGNRHGDAAIVTISKTGHPDNLRKVFGMTVHLRNLAW